MSAELWKQYLGFFNSSKLTVKLKKEPIQFIGNKHPTKKARHFLRLLESNFNFAYSTIKIILLAVCISRATYITSQIFELYFKRKLFIWPTVKSELFWTPLVMALDQSWSHKFTRWRFTDWNFCNLYWSHLIDLSSWSQGLCYAFKCSNFSFQTPCLAEPCKNGGMCKPNYGDGNYECQCLIGSKGKNCHEGNIKYKMHSPVTF